MPAEASPPRAHVHSLTRDAQHRLIERGGRDASMRVESLLELIAIAPC